MAVMPYATVVGVFRNRSAADLAMDALTNVGFQPDQMRCLVADSAGGFIDSLKSVFTGLTPVEETLVHDLTQMGLTNEEALYFSDEYTQGSAILAIKTQGDDEMALDILYRYGANNAREQARFGGVTPDESLSSPHDDTTAKPTDDAQSSSQADNPIFAQQDEINEPAAQEEQQKRSINTDALYQSFPPLPFGENLHVTNVAALWSQQAAPSSDEEEKKESNPPADESSPEQETDDYQIVVVPPEFEEAEYGEESEMPVYQTEQDDEEDDAPVYQEDETLPPDPAGSEPQDFATSEAQPASASPEWSPSDQTETYEGQPYSQELQQLLAQVEETKQQLQEARARLELAKKHQSLFTTARQQLKELQAELQATQAELEETHRRMTSEQG
jgi:hypothetical protein